MESTKNKREDPLAGLVRERKDKPSYADELLQRASAKAKQEAPKNAKQLEREEAEREIERQRREWNLKPES